MHDLHEKRVVRASADDADLDAVVGIPSGEGVDDVNLLAGIEIVFGTLAVDLEGVLTDVHVDIAPPDVICGGGVFGDSFIAGRTASFFTGVGNERTESRKASGWFVADCVHVKPRSGRITDDIFGFDTEVGKIDRFHRATLT